MSRLVVHPQRSGVSIGILVITGLLSLAGVTLLVQGPFHAWRLFVLVPLALVPFFAFAVLRRVELELRPGELALTWLGWPYRPERRVVRLDDLRDIVVEEDDGANRVVFLLAHERVPLTHSYTGDNLEPLVARLKTFLSIP